MISPIEQENCALDLVRDVDDDVVDAFYIPRLTEELKDLNIKET